MKMGNPAIGILHKNPEAELNRELLRRYRGNVEHKSYNYNLLEQYLDENFDYRERTVEGLELQFFKESYEADCPEGAGFSPISFLILENSKSERLYSAQCDSSEITLTIEKESGFFSTDSWVLHEELFLARGVTQEDIESENRKFLDYLFYLDKYKSGRAQIGPTAE